MEDSEKPELDAVLPLKDHVTPVILQHIKDFKGQANNLESALGALVIGMHFGWRVLKITHTPATYRSYEKILGIKYQEVCPEITPLGKKKSIGYAITQKIGSFWAVIMGRKKVPNKGGLASEEEVQQIAETFEVDKQ